MLSIVIPTLNAADTLTRTLNALIGSGIEQEVVVADGGSTDFTPLVAERCGARVVRVMGGRGAQLRAGAEATSGEWLLFLHPDAVLEPGWGQAVAAFRAHPLSAGRAAFFRFRLDHHGAAARGLEALVRWRCRRLGLPYGDQGLLLRRAFYDGLGGYSALPLIEDIDLARRIGRERLVGFRVAAIHSPRRGFALRAARDLARLGLHYIGVAPRLAAHFGGNGI
ncbi:MAG: glycosyltransferase [Alphaproteobacteria bacterium]|nr:glycosyltransferase [Alphaproteobacteria bacterium]